MKERTISLTQWDIPLLRHFFQFEAYRTHLSTELLAGLSTFLTMSYIIFVNPTILAQTGMNQDAVFVATCLTAAIGSLLMGLIANYPIGLAPGMGLNAYFTYGVVLGAGYTWQAALGIVFVAGVFFFLFSVLPIRKYIIDAIPKTMKMAIVAGIGMFLCFIGFKTMGLVTSSEGTLVTLGDMRSPTVLFAFAGFFLIVALESIGVMGSIIISILSVTLVSTLAGYNHFNGIFAMPPSLSATFMQMDLSKSFQWSAVPVIFAFCFVNLFDNTGTLLGIAHKAGLIKKDGQIPGISRALLVDSGAAILSPILGTSTTTSYVESTIGVQAGGRTGMTAVTVALLFLLALFFAPLAQSIPAYATAPALIYVACLMIRAVTDIDWDDITEYVPAVLMTISMALTFSIADGIAIGFISYTGAKVATGRVKELNIVFVILTLLIVAKYAILK